MKSMLKNHRVFNSQCVIATILWVLMSSVLWAQNVEANRAAQSASVENSTFEVASIHIVPPERSGLTSVGPYNERIFTATNIPLSILVALAYNLDSANLEMPKGTDSISLDVSARRREQGVLSYETLRPPLQQLLKERFHLVVHHSERQVPGYALVVVGGTEKLTPTKLPSAQGNILPSEIRSLSISMKIFAALLSRPVRRPVIDQTRLTGNYEISLHYAPVDATDSELPSIFTAVQEQLGLKLVPQKVPVDFLIVDHVDKEPTSN